VIVVTPAVPGNVEAMAVLFEEMDRFYGATEAELGPLNLRIQQINDALFRETPAAYALLGWDDGRLVGFAAYSFLWPAIGLTRSLYLKELYVAQNARRRRIGERLMEALFDYAVFGPTDVAIYDVQASVEFGNPARAVHKAETVDTSVLRPELRERRSHHLIDVARAHTQLRDDASALVTLLEAERIAPQELKYNTLVRATVREMLRRERRTIRPALRGLAGRVGVLD